MKKIFLLLLLSPLIVYGQAQVLDGYPDHQSPYVGGYSAYYKDFHDIIVEKKLQSCANPSEFYQFSVLINADASINFIKDQHADYLSANKCAADLAREVAKHMTKWNPATLNGVKQAAVARFNIFPAQLFEDEHSDYTPSVTGPVYNNAGDNHMEHFRKQLKANLNLKRFSWEDRFTVEAEFIITKEGKLEDIVLTKKTGLEEFDRMVFYAYRAMKKKWVPATVNSKPVDYRYKYQLTALTELEY